MRSREKREATPPDIATALAAVLNSRAFARASRQRALLRFLVGETAAGRAAQLKESSIALDVFARNPSSYDPSQDPIVRVSANRLRELLDRYYADEGHDAPLRIELPRGGYVPIFRRTAVGALPTAPRIAVLPLANFTGEPELEALCDGLSEDLIDSLAQIDRVRVVARTSSFSFKGKAIDVRQIARELDVDAVLEGSLQRIDAQLRVTAQLILAADGTHLWSRAFEADAADRASLRRALIDLTERTLGSIANDRAETPTDNGDGVPQAASDAYYRALYQYRKDTLEGFLGAERTLAEALAIAPDFARAQALLGKVLWALGNSGERPLRAAAEQGASAARRAYALEPEDPLVAQVHTRYLLLHDYRPDLAIASATLAAERAPNDVDTLLLLGYIGTYTGHHAIARDAIERARRLDPLSLDPLNGLVNHLIFARDYPAALELCNEILAREPSAVISGWNRAHSLRMMRRIAEAREAFAETLKRSPSSACYERLMEAIYSANEGKFERARELRGEALAHVPWDNDPMTYALLDALLGDDAAVYRAWEHSISLRDPYVYSSYYHEEFDRFRHEPRFQAITDALGLPRLPAPKMRERPGSSVDRALPS